MPEYNLGPHKKLHDEEYEIIPSTGSVGSYTNQMPGVDTTLSGYSLTSSQGVQVITNNLTVFSLAVPNFDTNSAIAMMEHLLKDPHTRELLAERMASDVVKSIREKLVLPGREDSCKAIPDDEAETEIREYVVKAQESGKNRVDLLEIVYELDLPPDQIERVMENLRIDGVRNEPHS